MYRKHPNHTYGRNRNDSANNWAKAQEYVMCIIETEFLFPFFLSISSRDENYRIVASTNTCYYSENQVFGGVTIRVLCSKRGCY